VKRRLFASLGCATVALAALAFLGSAAGAAAPSAPSSTAPVVLPVSALTGTGHRGGLRPPIGYLPLHARELAAAKAAANARAGVNQGAAATSQAAGGATVSSYANVSPSFDGIYQSGGTPPDTTGAIGPDRYIEAVNTSYAIFSRSGTVLGNGSLSSLTGVQTGLFGYGLSDPQVMWDAKTQRFYYAVLYYDSLFFSDNGIAFGFSKTATPGGAADFCRYALSYGSELPDYPKLGDSSDFLLFGSNNFGNYAQTYDGSAFEILNKPPAGSTCPTASTTFTVHGSGVLHNADDSLAATPVPANLVDDANGAGYVVANADLSTTQSAAFVSVYSVTTAGTDANGIPVPAVSGPRSVPVASYSMPANAPQQGSSYLLDTLDGRFEAAVAAVDPSNGDAIGLWTAHAVFGGGGAEERWYEIDPEAGSVLQSGKVSDPSRSIWNGAVSPDRANTGSSAAFGDSMAMSVSTSSATSYPAIQFVSKSGANDQSALQNLVQASGPSIDFSCSSTTPCRWGDYSGASPDPAAIGSGKVWLANQYNVAGGTTSSTAWRTWLFGVTPTSASPSATLAFATGAQALTAGQSSDPIQVGLSAAQPADVAVSLSSDSSSGRFAQDPAGPWSPTLQVTITTGQTTSPDVYYSDTQAGSPTLTASAAGYTSVTQTETVAAAPLATITVSPSSANLTVGDSQTFAASGADAFGNPVSLSGTNWLTTAPGTLSTASGPSTTFTAGDAGSGLVQATVGSVSGSAAVTVVSQTISAPTGVSASALRKRIKVSWQSVAGAASYNVYRSTTPGGEGSVAYASGLTRTSFNDSGVTRGTTYYYRITAVAADGTESVPSVEVSATAR
jgi:hypothetical protein